MISLSESVYLSVGSEVGNKLALVTWFKVRVTGENVLDDHIGTQLHCFDVRIFAVNISCENILQVQSKNTVSDVKGSRTVVICEKQ